MKIISPYPPVSRSPFLLLFLLLCLCASVVNSSCSSKPVNLRALAPAETLIYFETNDLGKTLSAITGNKTFGQLAKAKPDLSALKGIQLAIAVTGFETTRKSGPAEEGDAGESTVLDFKPRFAAIAETHAWNYQALAFTENKLGEFINQAYGGEVVLDTIEKNGGRSYTWTAGDGRRAFAFVQGSQVFFGNDEPAIEKCLAVKRGEAPGFSANAVLPEPSENTLASGYISPDGVAQASNIAAIGMAKRSGDEEDVQKFVAGLLPQLIRNTVREVTWTASMTGQGIEDRITITANPEASAVWKETLVVSSGDSAEDLAVFLPADIFSVTRYDLKNPQIAWRSVLLTAARQAGTANGNILIAYSGSLFEPYGVEDGEAFLSAVGNQIVTAKFDAEGEKPVVIVTIKDAAKVKGSIVKEVDFTKPPEKHDNADVWRSGDGDTAAAFFDNRLILGDAEGVLKCLQSRQNGQSFSGSPFYKQFTESKAVAVTMAREIESAGRVVDVVAGRKSENENLPVVYLTETRFNEKSIERRIVSDFGLIGAMIELFDE